MKLPTEFTVFGLPISRRVFLWTVVLCPGVALAIYLSTISRQGMAR